MGLVETKSDVGRRGTMNMPRYRVELTGLAPATVGETVIKASWPRASKYTDGLGEQEGGKMGKCTERCGKDCMTGDELEM